MFIKTKVVRRGGSHYLLIPPAVVEGWDVEDGESVKVDLIKDHELHGEILLVKK